MILVKYLFQILRPSTSLTRRARLVGCKLALYQSLFACCSERVDTWLLEHSSNQQQKPSRMQLLGRAQPVIPPNLYVNEHNSLGSSGKHAVANVKQARHAVRVDTWLCETGT